MTATGDLSFGSVLVTPILDGRMGVVPRILYPSAASRELSEAGCLDAEGLVPLEYGGYLLRGSDGEVVLVDVGGGPAFEVAEDKGSLRESGRLLDQLGKAGVAPEDVTHVVFTHLHFDHCGGASVGGEPTFPRAVHLCHEADWSAFVTGDADARVKAAMEPLDELVRTWSADQHVLSWLRVEHCPGHTPGNAIVFVADGDAELALIGDLAHHPAEIANPDWTGGVDTRPEAVIEQRRFWFGRFADNGIPMAGAHFPGQRPVMIERAGGSFRVATGVMP